MIAIVTKHTNKVLWVGLMLISLGMIGIFDTLNRGVFSPIGFAIPAGNGGMFMLDRLPILCAGIAFTIVGLIEVWHWARVKVVKNQREYRGL